MQNTKTQKYSVNQHLIETILSWIKSGEIAIPEIQRPFVWKAAKVRDLMDSLYQGYPIGYLIAWRNPNIKLKDGSTAEGKKILIDGQQRVTALTSAVLGQEIVNKNYRRIHIKIAFNPLEEKFEVLNNAIKKDSAWIPDISKVLGGDIDVFDLVESYCEKNEGVDRKFVFKRIERLRNIPKKQIGIIELDSDLDIEVVTEIFIRINSQGVVLSQADFAMSKIAANDEFGGPALRKCIDYFCHLAVAPEDYRRVSENDKEFAATDYFAKLSWLKNENDDLYDPTYTDLLRVAFTSEFKRGRLSDLVSLLSGRNFETRTFEEEIAQASFDGLKRGVYNFINETNFKRFVMIIKSAGFITSGQIRSQNALNVAYMLYLRLRTDQYHPAAIEHLVRRWFVMSVLTGRYSGSAETQIDQDIRNIDERSVDDHLEYVEQAELSDAFWNVELIQRLDTSVASSPFFHVFLAAQVKANDRGFLSRDITVQDLLLHRGDVHHIFPRNYLKKYGLTRSRYNQIANYVYMQSEINIKVGSKAPNVYLPEVEAQCNGGLLTYGGITSTEDLSDNLVANCIPELTGAMDHTDYSNFLEQRRKLMAEKIRKYYFAL
jgi:hypothetical protein